jgi:hypothetical protein
MKNLFSALVLITVFVMVPQHSPTHGQMDRQTQAPHDPPMPEALTRAKN